MTTEPIVFSIWLMRRKARGPAGARERLAVHPLFVYHEAQFCHEHRGRPGEAALCFRCQARMRSIMTLAALREGLREAADRGEPSRAA